jgi:hypothetical protein
MFVATLVIMEMAGVDTYPTAVRIDVALPSIASGPMMIGTFMASEKSQMIKRTCICVGLAVATLLLFVLHELLPALGSPP